MHRASSISYGVRERFLGDEAPYCFAADLMQGAAVLRARELQTEPLMLALIDPDREPRAGGNGHTLTNCTALGLHCGTFELDALRRAQLALQIPPHDASSISPNIALRSSRETDWYQDGLPAGTGIRIGMHSRPVFPAVDPLLGRPSYLGSHVVRAARIEPITAPGSVYVSTELACVRAAFGDARFTTDYLGAQPLAKGFGQAALYRPRRCNEAE